MFECPLGYGERDSEWRLGKGGEVELCGWCILLMSASGVQFETFSDEAGGALLWLGRNGDEFPIRVKDSLQ